MGMLFTYFRLIGKLLENFLDMWVALLCSVHDTSQFHGNVYSPLDLIGHDGLILYVVAAALATAFTSVNSSLVL